LAGRKIAIHADHEQIGTGNIADGFEGDGDGRDGGMPPVGLEIVPEPLDQTGVVDLSDRILVGPMAGFAIVATIAGILLDRLGLAGFSLSFRHRSAMTTNSIVRGE